MIRKIMCCTLSVFISFIIFFSDVCIVRAEKPGLTMENITKSLIYVASTIGCVLNRDFSGWYDISMDFFDRYSYKPEDITVGDSGNVVIPDNMVDDLKSYLDSYIADCGDYVIYPSKKPSDMIDCTSGMHSDLYKIYLEELNKSVIAVDYYGIVYTNGASLSMVKNITDYYLVSSNPATSSSVSIYDSNCDKYKFSNTNYYRYQYDGSIKETIGGHSGLEHLVLRYVDSQNYYCITTPDGRGLKYWKSLNALQAYLRGTPLNAIYVSSAYNNYNTNNDNSIEINKEILNNYVFNDNSTLTQDLSQVVNNVTNTINNYYTTNGSTMTQADIQAVIDKALEDFLNSLPSGGGEEPTEPETPSETETETETETGGDISGNDVSGNGVDGPQTVGLLKKILNKLTEFFNFAKGGLMDSLNGIRGDIQSLSGNSISGNSVSGNGTEDPEVKSWLEKIYDKLKEIKWAIVGDAVTGGLGDLLSVALDKITDLADSVKDTAVSIVPEIKDMVSDVVDGTEETIGKMVGNVGTSMRPVGDKMKTKFPFSIPWDIAAVVGTMAATPETPVFEIPIVFERYDIDYTFTIDMSDFEVISKISRLFLSLTFILFLTKLTVQVVKMEKEL